MAISITFVIRQPGTASAFIPLIKQLEKKGKYKLTVLAYKHSVPILEQADQSFIAVRNFADAHKYLDVNMDYLVTGTSENVVDDELFWGWANENKIASLAFVDQWSNLTQRFGCQQLPAKVAVLDEKAEKELVNHFKGGVEVVITGSPVFDVLANSIFSHAKSKARKRVLFALEPDISGMSDDEIRDRQGFTEYDCLLAGCRAVWEYTRRINVALCFTLKPHPRDDQQRVKSLVQKLKADVPNISVDVWGGTKEEALMESDVVMGMRSMLLLEAAFVRKPVISIQLRRKTACLLTDERKAIHIAVTESDIQGLLEPCLSAPVSQHRGRDIQAFSAVERFIDILNS